jgi:hypothetical protein
MSLLLRYILGDTSSERLHSWHLGSTYSGLIITQNSFIVGETPLALRPP